MLMSFLLCFVQIFLCSDIPEKNDEKAEVRPNEHSEDQNHHLKFENPFLSENMEIAKNVKKSHDFEGTEKLPVEDKYDETNTINEETKTDLDQKKIVKADNQEKDSKEQESRICADETEEVSDLNTKILDEKSDISDENFTTIKNEDRFSEESDFFLPEKPANPSRFIYNSNMKVLFDKDCNFEVSFNGIITNKIEDQKDLDIFSNSKSETNMVYGDSKMYFQLEENLADKIKQFFQKVINDS
ncbi:hypothetical protein EDEG_01282 [Edhazardia aedis USNM 41457]|uniref:Uncharacterized protein n=1 Tax=Edhazardia aedis (strain USNM 41457) TaxID=1003232 RepID=J9DAF6_EDHAE|nr:hypothetical protein EDEG_01282 [Edhazardia aedis USNM 41457]|eukprot:EJW04489.1 hypothetical protein EDEG_01282 [Edhazardia aedis USNM 41457]